MYVVVLVVRLFLFLCCLFFFKQKTAYEMRISDWSSDVCSSDLQHPARLGDHAVGLVREMKRLVDDDAVDAGIGDRQLEEVALEQIDGHRLSLQLRARDAQHFGAAVERGDPARGRRDEDRKRVV